MADTISLKIDKDIINQYRREFGLDSDRVSNKDVVLYALAAGLPELKRDTFCMMYKLDKSLLDRILKTQETIAVDAIKDNIDILVSQMNDVHKRSSYIQAILSGIMELRMLARFISFATYTLGRDKNTIDKIFDRSEFKELDHSLTQHIKERLQK